MVTVSKWSGVPLSASLMAEPVKSAVPAKDDKSPPRTPDARTEPKPDPSYTPPVPPTTQPAKIVHLPPDEARKAFDAGMQAHAKGDLIAARTQLSAAINSGLPAHDLQKAREVLTAIAEETVFKPHVVLKDDPLVHKYTVKSGDKLVRIARQHHVSVDFLTSINKLAKPGNIRFGSTLKVVDGPFNVAVIKKDHVMHVYLQDVYLKSFPVALGMNGGTPSTSDVFTYNVTYTDGASNSTANSPSNPLTASPTAVPSINVLRAICGRRLRLAHRLGSDTLCSGLLAADRCCGLLTDRDRIHYRLVETAVAQGVAAELRSKEL